MIVTRGGKQHRLGFGPKRLGRTGKENVADHFRAGRTARLAGEQDAKAEGFQMPRQHRRMGGLTGALAAFEGYELTLHPSVSVGVGLMPSQSQCLRPCLRART